MNNLSGQEIVTLGTIIGIILAHDRNLKELYILTYLLKQTAGTLEIIAGKKLLEKSDINSSK